VAAVVDAIMMVLLVKTIMYQWQEKSIILIDNRQFIVYTITVKGKDVVRKLKDYGWQVARIKGSHFMMEKDGLVIPVPCHNKDMKIGTLKAIAKITGVPLP